MFNWFCKRFCTIPKPGDTMWVHRDHMKRGDPFPPKNRRAINIREVKDGWVRYDIGTTFPDQRLPLDQFLFCYKKFG